MTEYQIEVYVDKVTEEMKGNILQCFDRQNDTLVYIGRSHNHGDIPNPIKDHTIYKLALTEELAIGEIQDKLNALPFKATVYK